MRLRNVIAIISPLPDDPHVLMMARQGLYARQTSRCVESTIFLAVQSRRWRLSYILFGSILLCGLFTVRRLGDRADCKVDMSIMGPQGSLSLYYSPPSKTGHITPFPATNLPNIVFMMADDLGYGDVHYNGGPADTPNLDAMAVGPHSIQLTRYYSGGPVCSPTRGTVLTGRNHNRYCIWTANAGGKCGDFMRPSTMTLPTSEITVAEIVKGHGYRTAVFGKWHVGDLKPLKGGNKKWPVSHPSMHGFDEWWVTERKVPTLDPNCGCFNHSKCPYSIQPPCTNYHSLNWSEGLLRSYPQQIVGDDSNFLLKLFSAFLDDAVSSGQPFFVYLPLHAVHIRYIATKEYRDYYHSLGYNLNEANYYGTITAMDKAIGEVRELLKRYKVNNNTMLWFTSDNGPEEGTPGETGGFRGRKRHLLEGGIRVPGIIEWPAAIHKNRKSDFPVVSSDLLPTVCDILGIGPPSDRLIDGISILPFIHGDISSRNKSIAWAYKVPNGDFSGLYQAAISDDQYKVYAIYSGGKIQTAYLFDLVNDPFEARDISHKHHEIFKTMKAELERWRESVIKSASENVQCVGYSLDL